MTKAQGGQRGPAQGTAHPQHSFPSSNTLGYPLSHKCLHFCIASRDIWLEDSCKCVLTDLLRAHAFVQYDSSTAAACRVVLLFSNVCVASLNRIALTTHFFRHFTFVQQGNGMNRASAFLPPVQGFCTCMGAPTCHCFCWIGLRFFSLVCFVLHFNWRSEQQLLLHSVHCFRFVAQMNSRCALNFV